MCYLVYLIVTLLTRFFSLSFTLTHVFNKMCLLQKSFIMLAVLNPYDSRKLHNISWLAN